MSVRGLALSIVLLGCSGSGQTLACARYLTCSEAVEPGSRARLEGTYGVSGRCWQNDGIAKDCDQACKNAWAALGNANPEVQACW